MRSHPAILRSSAVAIAEFPHAGVSMRHSLNCQIAVWPHSRHSRRAFSLIEVLLAIFILGIGVISIAALFPAGIAQQRLSVDDMMGPIVANSAMDVIRSKLHTDDFGIFEHFSAPNPRPTVAGDWPWMRPAILFVDDPAWPGGANPPLDESGAIDIFSFYAFNSILPAANRATEFAAAIPASDPPLYGIPFNRVKYATPPRILITQEERYYPAVSRMYSASKETVKPQYVWDCMFRRFQGKIMVGIFVYRVTIPGGGTAPNYRVQKNAIWPTVPPIPFGPNLDLANMPFLVGEPVTNTSPPYYSAGGAWDTFGPDGPNIPVGSGGQSDDAIVLGTATGTLYDPDDPRQAWQQPRQWIVDQNNNVHRVLGQTREDYDINLGKVQVELVRPLTPVLGLLDTGANLSLPTNRHFYYWPDTAAGASPALSWIGSNVVTDIWYVPLSVEYDLDNDGRPDGEWTLTPVYATVKEL